MRRKSYNVNYFETIDSKDKSYFLGFIFADGCLRTKKRSQLRIKVHKKDIDILEKFKKCIEYDGDIWFDKNKEMCQISISGKKLISDLEKNGLFENKTLTIKYPEISEKYELDFIRGYFDGDGYIGIKTNKVNHQNGILTIVSGSTDFLNKLNERMSVLIGIKQNKLYGPKNASYKFISWGSLSDIEKIYEKFYTKSDIFLDRKKIMFDIVYSLHKSKNKYRKW